MKGFLIAMVALWFLLIPNGQAQPPNVVYILADDLGYGDVSSYNENSKIQTPNIDELARQGIKFTDAHTSSSVCTPSRYGILTGRYNWRSSLKKGVLSGFSKALIPQDRLTVASMLKAKGYHTAFIGKWHLGWDWEFMDQEGSINDLNVHQTVDYSKPITNGPQDLGFTYSYGFSGSLDMPPYRKESLRARCPVKLYAPRTSWRQWPILRDLRYPTMQEKTAIAYYLYLMVSL